MPFAVCAPFWRDERRRIFLPILLSAMCSNNNFNWICSALKRGENPVLSVNVSIDCG